MEEIRVHQNNISSMNYKIIVYLILASILFSCDSLKGQLKQKGNKNDVIMYLSAEQTIEIELSENTERKIFHESNSALEWLLLK